jgi:hypothetical protein
MQHDLPAAHFSIAVTQDKDQDKDQEEDQEKDGLTAKATCSKQNLGIRDPSV